MSILIDILLETIQQEFEKKEPEWSSSSLSKQEIEFINKECQQDSEFDPSNKRQQILQHAMQGKTPILVQECPFGKVIAFLENDLQENEIPWGLWARIFRLYSEKKGHPFKVFFLANTKPRLFPKGHEHITSENINGGYTYPCHHDTIIIYRAEDATRVLLHELMHSCCLDKQEKGVDQVEAETEAWAELIYIALLSEGNLKLFQQLLEKQSAWMANQNEQVKKHMNNPNSKEFPWRYTLGKEEVWRRWGICTEEYKKKITKNTKARTSLRLTFPVDNVIKRRFQVKESSTIL